MARKPKIPEHANHERWLVSYADFITLLFAFFTVLYATAQTDSGKVKKFVGAAERAFNAGVFSSGSNEFMMMKEGGNTGREIIDLGMNLSDVEKKIGSELRNQGETGENIKLERHADGLTLQLQTRHFFTPGSDALRPEALATLPAVIDVIKKSRHKLRIEGHTDDIPIHNDFFESNWELSTGRALSVLRYLIRGGITPERLSAAGMGEHQPLQSNSTEEGRSRNRRVEIVILEEKQSFWDQTKKPSAEKNPKEWKPLITNDTIELPTPAPETLHVAP